MTTASTPAKMVHGPDFYPSPLAEIAWALLTALLWVVLACWRVATLPAHIAVRASKYIQRALLSPSSSSALDIANNPASAMAFSAQDPCDAFVPVHHCHSDGGGLAASKRTVRFDADFTADVLVMGPPAPSALLLLPGNPGVVEFYREYLSGIQQRVGSSLQCIAIGHAAHGRACGDGSFHNLDAQVAHQTRAVRLFLQQHPETTRVILAGHSIGAHLCLEVTKALSSAGDRIVGIFALFPTIHHIGAMRVVSGGTKLASHV